MKAFNPSKGGAIATLTVFAALILSGCLSTAPTPAPGTDEVLAAQEEGNTRLDPAVVEALDVVKHPAYAALKEVLAAQPGFLGLAPALDGSRVLHAVYSGDAATTLPLPAPDE